MGKKLVSIVGTAVLALALAVGVPTAAEAATWKAWAKCQVVQINPNTVVGYVEGYGEGNSEANARSAALKDVDKRISNGQYKRHCQVTTSSRSRPGGGRF